MARLLAALRAQIRATSLPTALFTALVGIVFCTLPGLNTPNYHTALFLAPLLGLVMGPTAVRAGLTASSLGEAARITCQRIWLPLLIPLALLLLNGFRVRLCDVASGVQFYLMGPLFTGLWTAGLGALLGFVLRRQARALVAFYGVFLVWLAWELWVVWAHPPIFVFNPYVGYFQGAIYDTVIEIEPRYLWYRLNNLAQLGLLWALVWAWKYASARAWGVSAALGLTVVGFSWSKGAIGYELRRSDIAERLGGLLESPRVRLIYDRKQVSEAQAQVLLEAHLYRLEQLDEELGRPFPRQVTAWIYGSTAQKRALMGAGQVYIAKPWLDEIHLGPVSPEAPVIKHELAHVVLSLEAPPILHVPAQWCVLPHMALVEGAAEAFEWDTGALSPHEWAKALREVKRAPELRRLLSPEGFYNQGSERAYTLTGSFIRYLIDRFGVEAFRDLYRDGDFERVYRIPVQTLIEDWEGFIDGVSLSADALALVQGRFHSQAIHHRPCGLDVARTEAAALQAIRQRELEQGVALYEQVIAWIPEDASKKLQLLRVLARWRPLSEVEPLYQAYLASPGARNAIADLEAEELFADALLRAGQDTEAHQRYRTIAAQSAPESRRRTRLVKAHLSADPQAKPALLYLLDGGGEGLEKATPQTDESKLIIAYLAARHDLQNEERHAEKALLELLPALEIPPASHKDEEPELEVATWLLREVHAMLASFYDAQSDFKKAAHHFEQGSQLTPYTGDAARLRDRARFMRWRLKQASH